jgi:hypothetical protein
MKVYFDADDVLHIVPKNSKEVMALKYWIGEFKEHGVKMLAIETEVPPRLPAPGADY